jgi:class 3 adenylate cyclase/YHS domain-containing protein
VLSEIDRTPLIADLSGYTALTETHGALHASEVVLRFGRMAETSLEPGVVIVDRVGDQVLCAGPDPVAVFRTALRLSAMVEREPDFLSMQAGIHRGAVVEREGRLFGSPLNLTARIAAHARRGQILFTEPIARAALGVFGVESRSIGERRFKNVSLPVVIYELVRPGGVGEPGTTDPVCRMRVENGRAVATLEYEGAPYHFCSHECARLFAEAPERYVGL